MLTIKQRFRLWWFKNNNRNVTTDVINNMFNKYSEDTELFYEINKYIISILPPNPGFLFILDAYARYYDKYPIKNVVKRIIRERIEKNKIDTHDLCRYIRCVLLQECYNLATFLVDSTKVNGDNGEYDIEKLNILISGSYLGFHLDQPCIYKYMVRCGADYKLIPKDLERSEIEREYLMSNLCLLVKILKNIPNELMDVNKMTNNIGQFMREKSMPDYSASGTYNFVVGKYDLTQFGPEPVNYNVAHEMANQLLSVRNFRIDFSCGSTL